MEGLPGEEAGRKGSLDVEFIRKAGLQVSDQANCLLLMVLLHLRRQDFDTIPVNKGDCMKEGCFFFIVRIFHWEEDDVTESLPSAFSQAILL